MVPSRGRGQIGRRSHEERGFADGEELTQVRGQRNWISVSGFHGDRIFYRQALLACAGDRWHHIAFEYQSNVKLNMTNFVRRAAQALEATQNAGCDISSVLGHIGWVRLAPELRNIAPPAADRLGPQGLGACPVPAVVSSRHSRRDIEGLGREFLNRWNRSTVPVVSWLVLKQPSTAERKLRLRLARRYEGSMSEAAFRQQNRSRIGGAVA